VAPASVDEISAPDAPPQAAKCSALRGFFTPGIDKR